MEEEERILRSLRRFGAPAADFTAPLSYPTLQRMFDAQVPPRLHYYLNSVYLGDLRDGTIAVIIDCAATL